MFIDLDIKDIYNKYELGLFSCHVVSSKMLIVLIFFSMEECEALCSRLSIMVNGQMECLGSIQHLKNKYGDGYTISVILKSTDKRYSVQQFFEQNVQGCTLCDTRYRTLTYEVTVLQENLAHLFKVLENLFKSEDIEDYSVSQNTLDNVSIHLVFNL